MRSADELLTVELKDMTAEEQHAQFERDQNEIRAGRVQGQEAYKHHTGNTQAPRLGL